MTTRSTKMIPSASSVPSDSNPQTPTKRKRSQHDNPGAGSWLGIAFQLPSVIKKEINDFVKTIRGGVASQAALHPSINNPKTDFERTTRHSHRRFSQSVTAVDDRREPRNLHSTCRSIRRRGPTSEQAHSLSRILSPDFYNPDLPSPKKKLRRAGMLSEETNMTPESFEKKSADKSATDQHHPSSHDLPEHPSTIQPTNSITSLPPPATMERSHEMHDNHTEMEEIICNRPKKVGKRIMCQSSGQLVGYNSVLFPDSRTLHQFDSPGSSVNADVVSKWVPSIDEIMLILTPLGQSSSTWQASSSLSVNSGSNMFRGFSNHTSLTSSTSVEFNQLEELQDKGHHSIRLNSASSQPSPRIRHTKLLGSPRNHHTLSASSISSIGSVLTSEFMTRPNSRSQLQAGPQHMLTRDITYSLSNVDPPSENEREFLTSDSEMNQESPAAIQIGRRVSSHRPTLTCRRKVPLSEIIGRPPNPTPSSSSLQSHPDFCRESVRLNPSQSIASITSSFSGCPQLSSSTVHLQSQPAVEPQSPLNQSSSKFIEESGTPAADTSATLSVLRNQLSSTMRIGPSSPSEPVFNVMSQSLPIRRQTPNQGMIMEVDEEGEDNSYEFLDVLEAQSLSPETPHRKRKRLLRRSDLIGFRRQGLAAVQQSPSKLIDLPSNLPSAKPKTNVIKMLRLSRGHKRHQSASQDNLPSTCLNDDEPQSPTKKIRILETEIARLRQELENEKTKSAQRSPMINSCNQLNETNDSPHVAFSSHSLCMSSPVSSRPLSRHHCSRNRGKEPEVASDSPVMVKKPPDGALVGGSPFIVSRVFGHGPDAVGERTPVQAEKWLHKKKTYVANQGGGRLPALAHDLFGANPFKSSSSTSAIDTGRPASPRLNVSSGWKRDHQLEADLISTPKARTLKKIHRNSRGATALPSSQLRNMLASSTSDLQRNSGSSAPKGRHGHTNSQPPDMTTFLNELKASGKTKLRKTPGSAKYYMSQSFTSPKGSPRKSKHSSRGLDVHSASILSSVLQNVNDREPGRESKSSRVSTLSGRTATSAPSTNTLESQLAPSESWNAALFTTADHGKPRRGSDQDFGSPGQVKSPLSQKVYPSGITAKKSQIGDDDDNQFQVVLGEAISTPRKSKQASHLSRSLVESHLTPRTRSSHNDVAETTPTLEKDFSMDELIKQVKHLKDNEAVVNGQPITHTPQASNPLQNRELVHQMGFCSSAENSVELASSLLTSTAGSALSDSSTKPSASAPFACPDVNRQRTSPLLKSLTEGRPKPSTSPIKNLKFVPKSTNNRWSSSSTIRLVSILNNSSDGRSDFQKSGLMNASARSRAKPNERRVRILEDSTNLNHSTLSTDHNVQRHSLPADLITRNLLNSSEVGNRDLKQANGSSHVPSDKSLCPSAPDWVVVKPDSKRPTGAGEPNLRRWSLRASAILSTHPKIV